MELFDIWAALYAKAPVRHRSFRQVATLNQLEEHLKAVYNERTVKCDWFWTDAEKTAFVEEMTHKHGIWRGFWGALEEAWDRVEEKIARRSAANAGGV